MSQLRTRKSFNRDWLFFLGDDTAFRFPAFDDSAWRPLRLPHDWSIEMPLDERNLSGAGGGYAAGGIGWYRRHFSWDEAMTGKKVSLLFDGVYMDCRVYLNGTLVGANGYGYNSFAVDLTDALSQGENVLAVRVDNSRLPNSRWYSGSGIYRNVWLEITDRVHLARWGLFCSVSNLYPELDAAALQIRAGIENETDGHVNSGVLHCLYDTEGNKVLQSGTALSLEAGERGETMVRPSLKSPHLWTDSDPYLYTLESTVLRDGKPTDTVSVKVGLRTATFDCDRGFLLNGVSTKIKGMCVHHDCGLTGAVGYRETWERRLKALKEMGCNGIRCAHNPPVPELLDLCDELGFLVMDEAFDEWLLTKDKINNYYSQSFTYGSSQFFSRDGEDILRSMIRRDRNHPSVILWSIGNEIPEQCAEQGPAMARRLCDICHEEDSTRMTTSACDNIAAGSGATLRAFEEALDVVGYNYVDRWRERAETLYDEDRKQYPRRRFIGSENISAGGDRGVYEPRGKNTWFRSDYRTVTHKHEWLWRYTCSRDFVAGDYLWTGIDYLGEAPWPRRGACCGPLDTAGFPKDTYYYFRSIWNRDALTLHIAPHWNWAGTAGEYRQVIVYTNCDKVDLYINGRLVGTKACKAPYYGATKAWNDRPPVQPTTHDLHLTFDVTYEPGELKAVGWKDGKPALEETVRTTGSPAALLAEKDRETLTPDGVAHIALSTVDANGLFVPTADLEITCEVVSGPGSLVGMDGGDLLDLSPYASPKRRMFSGRLLAMISANAPGPIRVRFSAEGMEPVFVSLNCEGLTEA